MEDNNSIYFDPDQYENDSEEEGTEDQITDKNMEDNTIDTTDEMCPNISLSQKTIHRIRNRWKSGLIVKLMGKSISYKMLCTQSRNIWGLQCDFEAVDLNRFLSHQIPAS